MTFHVLKKKTTIVLQGSSGDAGFRWWRSRVQEMVVVMVHEMVVVMVVVQIMVLVVTVAQVLVRLLWWWR